MNQQPSVCFIEPKYRFRIVQRNLTENLAKNKSVDTHKILRLKLVAYDGDQLAG